MQYADSVEKVLLRKIQKAEQDLMQLKLDYCRFIFGLTHRSQVRVGGDFYQVKAVDVDSMVRQDDGSFSRPALSGVPVNAASAEKGQALELVDLGDRWSLVEPQAQTHPLK